MLTMPAVLPPVPACFAHACSAMAPPRVRQGATLCLDGPRREAGDQGALDGDGEDQRQEREEQRRRGQLVEKAESRSCLLYTVECWPNPPAVRET